MQGNLKALKALRSLSLASYSEKKRDELSVLAAMRHLTLLKLDGVCFRAVPEWMRQLNTLQHLLLRSVSLASPLKLSSDGLAAFLPHRPVDLLVLENVHTTDLSFLARLDVRRLVLAMQWGRDASSQQQLVPGLWLQRVQILELPVAVAQRSLDVLTGASQLEQLALFDSHAPGLGEVVRWAVSGGAPLLRCLSLHLPRQDVVAAMTAAAEAGPAGSPPLLIKAGNPTKNEHWPESQLCTSFRAA